MDEQQAAQFAIRVVDDLVDAWGGQMICFPTSYKRKLLQREEAVYSRFNGNNYAELSHEYGMGERGIRKLIARVRQRKLAEKAA
ncbi:Mor transcription activator family protein [Paracidovorax anthurii]|uniref:Mor transcription activator family protein n=2 Tax=Paracidovorax anthurii TaxID=78229 RepID=A0A328YLP0_9BURK|nr:Mor transcription activator family protein [Paracidovorax anthurii]